MNILNSTVIEPMDYDQNPYRFLSRWLQSNLMNALEKAKTQCLSEVA
ncbi:hypothetical protein [Bartonella machadoae]|nr:hypothetical protein [Bartonella machadoae]UNE54070.1 hypothetical protein LNM86_11060 [Bartonella machadoae]